MTPVSRILARERLEGVRRWPMPPMDRATTIADGKRPAPAPTTAELEAAASEARKQGHDDGFARGLAEGREAARLELEHQSRELHALCDALARPLQQVDAGVERQLAELATLIAERVLETELRLQPEQLLAVVRKALASLPAAAGNVEIRVHPDAVALLGEQLTEAEDHGWHIRPDAELAPGDCRVTGTDSRIDATVATRLKTLVDAALSDIA